MPVNDVRQIKNRIM